MSAKISVPGILIAGTKKINSKLRKRKEKDLWAALEKKIKAAKKSGRSQSLRSRRSERQRTKRRISKDYTLPRFTEFGECHFILEELSVL